MEIYILLLCPRKWIYVGIIVRDFWMLMEGNKLIESIKGNYIVFEEIVKLSLYDL